jgi:phosphoribosylanthranilate isomerase
VTTVKICGLRTVDHALVAAGAGADFIGLVFAPSRRQVSVETAREIVAAVRPQSTARAVGVFVDATPTEMNRVVRACDLDYVQLSGQERDDIIAALDVPAIRVIHVGHGPSGSLAERIAASPAELVLLDTARTGMAGGTGKTFDWGVVPAVDRPLLIAGGLHPDNVASALDATHAWGVDVSSGVETDGVKDPAKIRAFIEHTQSWQKNGRSPNEGKTP